ncbi:hypothetical protein HRE53_24115 [Acaryochloris sp. 'Moss Beach']|uniref:hypothetical protein n=1 Tax=Acaryochloris sp. 'Moss Beach' TaxID=2740837 RepID=UPI001F24497A|nr:hypothetical protein [Acaryochloris sp. 'Moss Beach']UJB69399.1 hypothetical protein HRE53_24115 [Acaryochloris sp. 'Moss Beach']
MCLILRRHGKDTGLIATVLFVPCVFWIYAQTVSRARGNQYIGLAASKCGFMPGRGSSIEVKQSVDWRCDRITNPP